jgi:hypothetical protein
MAERAAAIKAQQGSALSGFLGNADPVARVGAILRDKAKGQAKMAELSRAVDGNADAKAWLQRAVADYITRDLIKTPEALPAPNPTSRPIGFRRSSKTRRRLCGRC